MKQLQWNVTKSPHKYPEIDATAVVKGCHVRVHNHFRGTGSGTGRWYVSSTTLDVDSCNLEAESLEDAKHKALHHLHNIARERMQEAQRWAVGLMDAACAPTEET